MGGALLGFVSIVAACIGLAKARLDYAAAAAAAATENIKMRTAEVELEKAQSA